MMPSAAADNGRAPEFISSEESSRVAERRIHSLSTEVANKRQSFHFWFPNIVALAVTVFGVRPLECKQRENERDVVAAKGLSFILSSAAT